MKFNTLLLIIAGGIYVLSFLFYIAVCSFVLIKQSIYKKIRIKINYDRDIKIIDFMKKYDKVVLSKVGKYYIAIYTIYLAINPVINATSNIDTLSKYLSFISTMAIVLTSEFWFLFKKKSIQNNLKLIWKLSYPIISGLYLVLLIINYIPDLSKLDFLRQYLTIENKNTLLAGFVIFIALRRLVDDIIKRVNKNKYASQEIT